MTKKVRTVLLITAVALAAWIVSKNFLQIILIRGNSMFPTYRNGEIRCIWKYSTELHRGDVIVFLSTALNELLVKRIVGLPGETVQIKNGSIYVNGEIMDVLPNTPYIEYAGNAAALFKLGEGEYFVLGDNVQESRDSRYDEIGIVFIDNVVGKVL